MIVITLVYRFTHGNDEDIVFVPSPQDRIHVCLGMGDDIISFDGPAIQARDWAKSNGVLLECRMLEYNWDTNETFIMKD